MKPDFEPPKSWKTGDLITPALQEKFTSGASSWSLFGIVTGEEDEHGRKVVMWSNGKRMGLEWWEERNYEVISHEKV